MTSNKVYNDIWRAVPRKKFFGIFRVKPMMLLIAGDKFVYLQRQLQKQKLALNVDTHGIIIVVTKYFDEVREKYTWRCHNDGLTFGYELMRLDITDRSIRAMSDD